MANDGEVVGGESGAYGRLVFVELDVEAPVEAVFDLPMTAHGMSDPLCIGRQGTDVVAALAAGLGADGSLALDDREALQVQPLVSLVEAVDRVERPATSHFRSTVTVLFALRDGTWRQCATHTCLGEQEGFDELGMVVLDAQHVVGTPFANRLRNACLRAHRVDRDDTALQRQRCQQLGNRRDLIGLRGRRRLTEHQADVGREGTDQVQGARRSLGRAAPTGLAVDRHHRVRPQGGHPLADPAPKGGFELAWVERGKYAAEGVVRGDTVLEHQEAPQPVDALLGPCFDVGELVRAAQHGAHRDREQLGQIVPDLPRAARVGNRDENLRERNHFPRLHGNPKRRGNYTISGTVNSGFASA